LKKCDEIGAREWQLSTDKAPYYAVEVYTIKTEEDARSINVVPTIQKFKRALADRVEVAKRTLFNEKFLADRFNEVERFVADFDKIDGYMKSLETLLQAASPNMCDLYKKWHAVEEYAMQLPLYRDFLASLPGEIEQDVGSVKKSPLALQLFNVVKKPFQQRLTSGVIKTIERSNLQKNESAVEKYVQFITDEFLKLTAFINDNAVLISMKLTELALLQESIQAGVKSTAAQAKRKSDPLPANKPRLKVLAEALRAELQKKNVTHMPLAMWNDSAIRKITQRYSPQEISELKMIFNEYIAYQLSQSSQKKPVVSVLRQFEAAYKTPECKQEAINYWEEYHVEMGEYISTTLTPFEVLLSEKRGDQEEKQLKAEKSVFSWFQPRQDAMKKVLEKCKLSQPSGK
jgi:hypothetical protein